MMRLSVLMKAATTGSVLRLVSKAAADVHSLCGVGRQGWGRLWREGRVAKLMHGDNEQGGTVVDCGWRMEAVTMAWAT